MHAYYGRGQVTAVCSLSSLHLASGDHQPVKQLVTPAVSHELQTDITAATRLHHQGENMLLVVVRMLYLLAGNASADTMGGTNTTST